MRQTDRDFGVLKERQADKSGAGKKKGQPKSLFPTP